MSIKKIEEVNDSIICYSNDHNPPSHMVFKPGLYEHTCSKCGKKQYFRVDGHFL